MFEIDSLEFIVSPNIKCIVHNIYTVLRFVYFCGRTPSSKKQVEKSLFSVFTEKVPRQTNIVRIDIKQVYINYLMHTQNKIGDLKCKRAWNECHYHLHLVFRQKAAAFVRSFVYVYVTIFAAVASDVTIAVNYFPLPLALREFVFFYHWLGIIRLKNVMALCWQSWCESHHEKRIKWCQCCLIVCACLMFIVK